MPPDVGGGLAAGGFFGAYEPGSHVGDAVGGVEVEGVVFGVFGVPEDVVVLGGPAPGGTGAVVVGPDDLVLEAVAAIGGCGGEELVEENFDVVHFARVYMQKERTRGIQDAMGFGEPRAEEAEVVGESVGVVVGGGVEFFGAVAMATEAGAVAGVVTDGAEAGTLLGGPGVEGRVDVDELDGGVGEGAERGEVFGFDDAVHGLG